MANLTAFQPSLSSLFTLRGGGSPGNLLQGLAESRPTRPTVVPPQGASTPGRITAIQDILSGIGGGFTGQGPGRITPNPGGIGAGGGFTGQGPGRVTPNPGGIVAGGGFAGQPQGIGGDVLSNAMAALQFGQLSAGFNPFSPNPLGGVAAEPQNTIQPVGPQPPNPIDLDSILNTIQPVGTPSPERGSQGIQDIQGLQGLLSFSRLNPQIAAGIFGGGGVENLLQRFQSMFTPFQAGNINSGVLGVLRGLRGGRTR